MSYSRIVGGSINKLTKGEHSIYSDGDISSIANKKISVQGDNGGVKMGSDPQKSPPIKLPLKANLIIFIKDEAAPNVTMNYDKMKKGLKNWSFIIANDLSDAKNQIIKDYSYTEKSVNYLVFKSHGWNYYGAQLSVKHKAKHSFIEKKDSSEFFIRKLIKDTSTILFTACSIIPTFHKLSLLSTEEKKGKTSAQIKKENENRTKNHQNAKSTAKNYYSFWIKGSKRNLFLNYTQSVSGSYTDKDGDKKLSNKDEYWFRFDEPFIENLKYAGFVWFTDGGSNYSYKPKFYQLKVKSAGGIEVHQTKDIENNEFIPEEKKIYKSL